MTETLLKFLTVDKKRFLLKPHNKNIYATDVINLNGNFYYLIIEPKRCKNPLFKVYNPKNFILVREQEFTKIERILKYTNLDFIKGTIYEDLVGTILT